MKKRHVIAIAILAAILALILPTLLAFHLARRQALQTEEKRALLYTQEILDHSERIAGQVDAAFRALAAAGLPPCSDAGRRLMRRLELASTYIDALGYISGNTLQCLSTDKEMDGIDVGPVAVGEPSEVKIRTNIRLPFSKEARFLMIERANYVAIVNNELPIDVLTTSKEVGLAVFSTTQKQILIQHGAARKEWIENLHGRPEAMFETKDRSVAIAVILGSLHYYIGAISSLPTAEVDAQLRKTTAMLLPIGIVASIVLIFAIYELAKNLLSMPSLIKTALKRKEFVLYYQPVVDLQTGKWEGAEALMRWRNEGGEVARPDQFIPIAENCGLIHRVTERMIEVLADDAVTVIDRFPNFHFGINLSPEDLRSETMFDQLDLLVKRANAQPGNLMIEATERSVMDPHIAGQTIRRLKLQGFRCAIDDFGIGYSSLSYLGNYDFDLLKIDQSFVAAVDTEAPTKHVVMHIIEIARALNLEMIAEGVETEAQAKFLREHGVQYAQGWLFAKAMPFDELLAGLEQDTG